MSRFAQPNRRLIVDTDLGLDDLVALAILRLQQCLICNHHRINLQKNSNVNHMHTNFRLCGVTLTSGISIANSKNAALLQRILSPGTPVYVGASCKMLSWNRGNDEGKPIWWTRTADRVANFLSSLPALETAQQTHSITAEEYISQNLNNPEIDILCMAPLSNVAKAIDLFRKRNPGSPIRAQIYIMGGILNNSKCTKRGESTAPFGYHDVFAGNEGSKCNDCNHTTIDHFGEFNFALDIHSARDLLAAVPSNIITLEACTLVPLKLRNGILPTNLSSVLARSKEVESSNTAGTLDTYEQLIISRRILLMLLKEFGTDETQWDSISAAIYCNAFHRDTKQMCVKQSELIISDHGVLNFPSQVKVAHSNPPYDASNSHLLYPAFTMEDEIAFYEFLSSILFD